MYGGVARLVDGIARHVSEEHAGPRRAVHAHPRVTQGPTGMIAVSVLSTFIAVIAVAFECDEAALVFLGLAVGVARYLA